jgi:hypothetical protein
MQLHKSEKARTELGAKVRMLTIRERDALLLADGHKTRTEVKQLLQLLQLLQDDGSLLEKLIANGYLLHPKSGVAAPLPTANETTAQKTVQSLRPSTGPVAPRSSSDNFDA